MWDKRVNDTGFVHNLVSQGCLTGIWVVVFTCALWGFDQSLPEDLPNPCLHLCPALSTHHRNHEVGRWKTPVGRHQGVDHRRGGVPRKTQELRSPRETTSNKVKQIFKHSTSCDCSINTAARLWCTCLRLVTAAGGAPQFRSETRLSVNGVCLLRWSSGLKVNKKRKNYFSWVIIWFTFGTFGSNVI